MANREELLIIRAARAGQAKAQLALGKRYLLGSTSLPQSQMTALHWLEKAAEQNQQEAWLLIGDNVSFNIARQHGDPLHVALWYERAFEGGSARAGLVLAMLVFSSWARADPTLRQKSLRALKASAESGLADAQWLYAQQLGMHDLLASKETADVSPKQRQRRELVLEWAAKAARGGVSEAQAALAEHAWINRNYLKFIFWALPMVQQIDRRACGMQARQRPYSRQELDLMTRCAKALLAIKDPNTKLIERYLRIGAEGGDSDAELAYGLWTARLNEDGTRISGISGVANYKKAIQFLLLAADKGNALAWYAISRIYLKPEFSRRSIAESRRYLEMAAIAGHDRAQLELGFVAWRSRRLEERSDIRAVYWLQKSAGQGNGEAKALLKKIAPPVRRAEWAVNARILFDRETRSQYPFLAARVELAYWFGLTRAEALLIDVESADQGHCLEIDIRKAHPRCRRRLVQVLTGEQRQALDRATRLYQPSDASTELGSEGTYRQRLYRFRSLIAQRRLDANRRA